MKKIIYGSLIGLLLVSSMGYAQEIPSTEEDNQSTSCLIYPWNDWIVR